MKRKFVKSFSIEESLLASIITKSEAEGISLSHALQRLLLIATGRDQYELDGMMHKQHKKYESSIVSITKDDKIFKTYPENETDFWKMPKRRPDIMQCLVARHANWFDGTPVSDEFKAKIKANFKKYLYLYPDEMWL